MYSKLFACILDSSVWLEPHPTRLVWITLLAAKDETGFARFAAPENLARRANVTMEEVEVAIATLEAPDPNSSNKDREGRRIERVPGGWMVVSAGLYDNIVRREDQRRNTRERVRKFRERQAGEAAGQSTSESLTDEPESMTRVDTEPPPTPPPASNPMDVLRSIPAIYRGEVEGVLKGHRNPASIAAEMRAVNSGMHGAPREWDTIGRAIHDILVAGSQVTSVTLRSFCDRLVAPPPAKGNGSKPTKSDRMYEELGAWVEGKEAEEAAAASEASDNAQAAYENADVVEAKIEPAPEKAPF